MIGSAYFTIDSERRFPYQAIWVTISVLELMFIVLNVLVLLMSTTSWIRDLSTLKFYIEGKLFGALYISAVVLAIYMCHRRAINMYGTYTPQLTGGITGSNIDDHVKYSQFHGKQLAPQKTWCHYVPRQVFDNKDDYKGFPAVSNLQGLLPTSCSSDSFSTGEMTNGTTTYTGLWVALAGMVLQVLLLIVTAVFHEGGAAAEAVDKLTLTLPKIRTKSASVQNRGFKTIQVV